MPQSGETAPLGRTELFCEQGSEIGDSVEMVFERFPVVWQAAFERVGKVRMQHGTARI